MNLVSDEGVDRSVIERPRLDGHDVVYVAELSPSVPDEAVLQRANSRSAVLLTADKDFDELVFRQGLVHAGVVLVRLAGLATANRRCHACAWVPEVIDCGQPDLTRDGERRSAN